MISHLEPLRSKLTSGIAPHSVTVSNSQDGDGNAERMQSTFRHGFRSAAVSGRTTFDVYTSSARLQGAIAPTVPQWTCVDCRLEAQAQTFAVARRTLTSASGRRHFSTAPYILEDVKRGHKQPISPFNITIPNGTKRHKTSASKSASLPSHIEKQRWQMSKDMTRFVDGLLARASVAGQHINAYTGTDYSGIEALRKEIVEQEQRVRNRLTTVEKRKIDHHQAYTEQASAQKEIVSLLERKSSWSPTDLERYMSLVRSEHVNDQAVQAAKDILAASERELEEARSLLEKLERKQYHEEQIWSDTIRRNGTWLTAGLMGLNILLLVLQIFFFEPYRRRKIVRDIKAALDEKTLHAPAVEAVQPAAPPSETAKDAVEEAKPAPSLFSFSTREGAGTTSLGGLFVKPEEAGKTPLAAGEVLPEEAVDLVETAELPTELPEAAMERSSPATYRQAFLDLFSERLIQIKRVELTNVALQGAATGVAAMGLLFVLLRPK